MQCRILHNAVEKVTRLFVYFLYSDLVIPNTSDPSFPEESHLYTEVDEAEKKRDGPYVDQKYENPLYEPAAADDSELNPIYGRFVRFNMNSLLIYNLI